MQRILGSLVTFLAVLAGVVALWMSTLLFFALIAFGAAAALAFHLGTGPRPITLRARRDAPSTARRDARF